MAASDIGKKKRTKGQHELDIVEMTDMYCKGMSFRTIAKELSDKRQYKIGSTQAFYDVQKALERWQKKTTDAIERHKSEELAKINLLERTYWEAWERSLTEKQSTSQSMEKTGVDKGEKKEKIVATTKKEMATGNPSFLNGIQWCINKRCEILGIDAPKKYAETDPDGNKMSVDKWIALIQGKPGIESANARDKSEGS